MDHAAAGSIEDCLQDEPAFCTVACPFRLDVRDFIAKLQRGGFNVAYRAFLNAVGFPGIVTALCDEPCKGVCPLGSAGGSISMRHLERAAVAYARNLDPNSYAVAPKNRKVAVIGAGISGLACALRLAEKGYDVTVFERTGSIGGHLRSLLQPDVLEADIARQFAHVSYELLLDTEIRDLGALEFDAVYVATGAGGELYGLSSDPCGAFASTKAGVFLGGSLTGAGSMRAIADGLRVGHAMERFIKAGGMNHPLSASRTRLRMDAARTGAGPAVLPANGRDYSRDEAVSEAKRCLRCACDACVRACDLMRYFRKSPRRIAEEVHLTVQPGTLDGNGTVATRLISTCNHCGLCREVCPQGIDTGGLLLESHRVMREKGAMPWAFHDYFLRDLAFANGAAGLSRPPGGYEVSRYMFFPGCQLGGSDPRYVTESYRHLLRAWPDTALMLACCGAPAEWAGDEVIRSAVAAKLREDWVDLGRPTAVLACPMCKLMLGRCLPEVEGVFLYDLIREQGLATLWAGAGAIAAVFDPCASRAEPGVQQTVRDLALRAGFRIEELPSKGKLARCCSFGGHVSIAHPPFAQHVVKERVSGSNHPYITYCSNCRDLFAAAGKPAWHILDLLFRLNEPDRLPPTITQRRRNRIELKREVLEVFWEESNEMERGSIVLEIAEQLRRKLNRDLLLETDLATVITDCERSGRKLHDPESGTYSGHLRIGNLTYWVEYRALPDGRFELVNAYGHRMSIEEA